MDEIKTGFDEEAKTEKAEVVKPRPYLVWKVNDKEYKLKLTTSVITKLEEQFDTTLTNAVLDDGIPSMRTVVSILQGAMIKFQHGVKSSEVADLVDEYIESGKTLMDLLGDVIYPLMQDAGFFTSAMMAEIKKELKNIDTNL